MPPGQLANSLLANWVGPSQRERPHVLQVRKGQTAHPGKLGLEIPGKPTHHPRPPTVPGLALHNVMADVPVQLNELGVHRAMSTQLG